MLSIELFQLLKDYTVLEAKKNEVYEQLVEKGIHPTNLNFKLKERDYAILYDFYVNKESLKVIAQKNHFSYGYIRKYISDLRSNIEMKLQEEIILNNKMENNKNNSKEEFN